MVRRGGNPRLLRLIGQPRFRLRLGTSLFVIAAVAVGLAIYRDRVNPRRQWLQHYQDAVSERRNLNNSSSYSSRYTTRKDWISKTSKGLVPDVTRRDVVWALLESLDENGPEGHIEALMGLPQFEPVPASAIPRLVGLLRLSDGDTRAAAAHTLGALFEPVHEDSIQSLWLVFALGDPDGKVREAALDSLGKIVMRSERPDHPLQSLILDCADDIREEGHIRNQAAAILRKSGSGPGCLEALDRLIFAHDDPECRLKFSTPKILEDGLVGNVDAATLIMTCDRCRPRADSRLSQTLARFAKSARFDAPVYNKGNRIFPSDPSVETVASHLKPTEGPNRGGGEVLVLGHRQLEMAVPRLIEATHHPMYHVRRFAIEGLSQTRLDDETVREALRVVESSDPASTLRELAASALRQAQSHEGEASKKMF